MSASQVDPHEKMRARDVSKVTRGEQAPRPAHEYGTVSRAPAQPTTTTSPSNPKTPDRKNDSDKDNDNDDSKNNQINENRNEDRQP